MVAISVSADIEQAIKGLNAFATKQIPFAAAVAINDVAFQVRKAEIDAIPKVFKKPRPFTTNSTQVDKATKSNPSAETFIRPEVSKYLSPYEFGGQHVLPGKALLNPIHQSVDAFGQLRKGAPKRLAARKDVFVGEVHGHWGFWQRPMRGTRRHAKLTEAEKAATMAERRAKAKLLKAKRRKLITAARAAARAAGTRYVPISATRIRNRGYGTKGKVFTLPNGKKTTLKLLIAFGRNAPVPDHLEFEKRAIKLVREAMPGAMKKALTQALAAAK
jgi:hypothetical protein